MRQRYPDLRVTVMTSLADGADRLACGGGEVAGDACDLRVADADGAGPARDLQYAQLGAYIAAHCHILLAVWDGRSDGLSGGTAQVVRFHQDDYMPGLSDEAPRTRLDDADDESDLVYHVVCSRDRVNGAPPAPLEPGRRGGCRATISGRGPWMCRGATKSCCGVWSSSAATRLAIATGSSAMARLWLAFEQWLKQRAATDIAIALIGLLPLIAAIRQTYARLTSEHELIEQYRFMQRILLNAQRHLARTNEPAERRQILRELGDLALREHRQWILRQRERPLSAS